VTDGVSDVVNDEELDFDVVAVTDMEVVGDWVPLGVTVRERDQLALPEAVPENEGLQEGVSDVEPDDDKGGDSVVDQLCDPECVC